jgi:hypothetical protein
MKTLRLIFNYGRSRCFFYFAHWTSLTSRRPSHPMNLKRLLAGCSDFAPGPSATQLADQRNWQKGQAGRAAAPIDTASAAMLRLMTTTSKRTVPAVAPYNIKPEHPPHLGVRARSRGSEETGKHPGQNHHWEAGKSTTPVSGGTPSLESASATALRPPPPPLPPDAADTTGEACCPSEATLRPPSQSSAQQNIHVSPPDPVIARTIGAKARSTHCNPGHTAEAPPLAYGLAATMAVVLLGAIVRLIERLFLPVCPLLNPIAKSVPADFRRASVLQAESPRGA